MEYEDRITIAAPEGIELDYTLAGLGSRFVAASVDALLRVVVLGALIGIAAAVGGGSTVLLVLLIVGSFLALFVYDVAFEVWAGGRTPGKRWSGLRVVMLGGQPVTFGPSAVRNLLRIVDEWGTAMLAGIVAILVTKRGQRLGDLAAGTVVIRERTGGRFATMPAPTASVHTAIDVTAVNVSELAAIRDFLARRERLTPESRARVAGVLAERIGAKIGGLTPGQLPPEQLLETIAAAKSAGQ